MTKLITILATVTCLMTLTSTGLTAYHSLAHAYYKDKLSGVVVRQSTSDVTSDSCPPATKYKIETSAFEKIISCPFRPGTKGVAFTSLILCQFFLILVCCRAKSKSPSGTSTSVLLILAIIVYPLLLVAGILMIVDMISGGKKIPDGFSTQPIEYILDVLFVFFGLITGLVVTYLSYMSRPNNGYPNHGYPNNGYPQAIPNHSQPTQHGNASMSMNKPQWTEGESQSVDYIKPYGNQTNISTYQAYQGANNSYGYAAQNNSAAYLQTNPSSNGSPNHRARGNRGPQNYQNQNQNQYQDEQQQTPDPMQNYDNPGYGNRRNTSYKDNAQTRQRQPNNYSNNQDQYQNNQDTYHNNNNVASSYGNNNNNENRPQRGANRNRQYNNNGNNNRMISYESNANNMRNQDYAQNNEGNRNHSNNAGNTSPERNPERSPDNNRYANHGGNRPNKFNSAVNRIGALRSGANAFDNGQRSRGYLNPGGDQSYQGNEGYGNSQDNSITYEPSQSNSYTGGHRGRSRSTNQSNYEDQYQGESNNQGNQRNTHVSQINGSNISNMNNNGMTRPHGNSIGGNRPSANYGGY